MMASWEGTKENIQPSKIGRNVAAIEQDPKELLKKQQEFELALRSYSGDDPLLPWYNYIVWVERYFPKGGNLKSLLKKCLHAFKDNNNVKQDERYVDIFTKYADTTESPLDTFSYMYNSGIGTKQPNFYANWAYEMEKLENYKKANQIFDKGLSIMETDDQREKLDNRYKLFQARVMKKMTQPKDDDFDDPEEQRAVLASLEGHGKVQKVGSIRIGAVKKGNGPGVFIAASATKAGGQNQIQVFQDVEIDAPQNALLARDSSHNKAPLPTSRNAENDKLEAKKWSQANLGKKSHAVPIDKISFKQPFAVHEDETLAQATAETPTKTVVIGCKVLVPRKPAEEHIVPLALFEPPDPMKKPMYAKHMVYQGTTEFSFEELRGIRYRQQCALKKLQQKEESLIKQFEQEKADFEKYKIQELEKIEKYKLQELEKIEKCKLQELEKMTADKLKQAKLEPIKKEPVKPSFQNDENSSLSLTKESSSVLDDTKSLLQKTPKSYEPPNVNTPSVSRHNLTQPSPTINMKEALNAVEQMWKSSDSTNQSAPFEIFEDPEPVEKKMSKRANSPLVIYQDDLETEHRIPIIRLPRPSGVAKTDIGGGKENIPPPKTQIYCDENLPPQKLLEEVQPLRMGSRPLPNVDDSTTMRLPTREDFEKMACTISTPFHGRQFVPEEDENTCNVHIDFKVPEVQKQPEKVEQQQAKEFQSPLPPPQQPQFSGSESEIRNGYMSPILEISREKSTSSSSSNSSQSATHLTKSIWGNTQLNAKDVSSGVSAIRTPGTGLSTFKPTDVSSTSGYMADSSTTRTPGFFLKDRDVEDKQKMSQPKETLSRLKVGANIKMPSPIVEDDDDDLTGVTDLMSAFQRDAGINVSKSCAPKSTPGSKSAATNSQSVTVNMSKLELDPERPGIHSTLNVTKQYTNEDEVTLPISSRKLEKSYQGRNMKSHSSFLSQSLRASFIGGDIDLTREMTERIPIEEDWKMDNVSQQVFPNQTLGVGGSGPIPNFELSELKSPKPTFEMSGYQPNPTFEVSEYQSKSPNPSFEMSVCQPSSPNPTFEMSECQDPPVSKPAPWTGLDFANLNPFCSDLHNHLLSSLPHPVASRHGYHRVSGPVPSIKLHNIVRVADVDFYIVECKGEGGFGKVYKAMKRDDSANPNETIANIEIVLKIQKPPREWEFYICTELHNRLVSFPKDCAWFMSIPRCYTFDDGSIFVSEYQNLTLLDVCNKVTFLKSHEVEPVALYFTIEMLRMAEGLKKARIIHADIKPENFLIQNMPEINPNSSTAEEMFNSIKPALQVIDFGVSIDLNLFPPGTSFHQSFDKAENKSPDMMEGRPWTYQLDYFGIASVAFVLLHGSFMKIVKNKNGTYSPPGSYKRWWNTDLWYNFFDSLLNIPDCNSLPDIKNIRIQMQDYFFDKYRSKFMLAIREVNNHCSKVKF